MPGPSSLMPQDTPSDVGRMFADLQRQINELRAARTAEATTIGAGGITVQGGAITVRDASGNALASIDSAGAMQAQGLSLSTQPEFSAPDYTGVGGKLYDILDRRPRTYIGYGAQYSDAPATNTAGGVGVFEIMGNLYAGRMYKLCTSVMRVDSSVANDVAEIQVRTTTAALGTTPAAPSITSTILARIQVPLGGLGAAGGTIQKLTASSGTTRFLLTYSRAAGTGTLTMRGAAPEVIEMWVEDIGPYSANLQQVNNGGGGAVPTPASRYTLTRTASWTQTYGSNGGLRGDIGNAARQGYYSPTWGNNEAFIGFPDMTADLAGGTVESVSLYLYANAWYSNAGGEAVIGRHSYTTPPGGLGPNRVDDMVRSPGWPNPGDRWVDLSAFNPAGWVDGSNRGIVLGAGSVADLAHYGTFDGAGMGHPPMISVTYRR